MTNDPLFSEENTPNVVDPAKDYLTELVGDGKKFKTPQELARSKAEADAHIARLESEMRELRTDLVKRATMEELVEKLKASKVNSPPHKGDESNDEDDDTQTKPKESFSREELLKILDEKEKERKKRDNVEHVANELRKIYGDDFGSKVNEAMNMLGVNKDFLGSMAETQPQAFVKLITNTVRKQNAPSDPNSSVNTSFFESPTRKSSGPEKTHAEWQEVHKADPARYFSREATIQRHRDAQALGDKFFS